MTLSPEAMIAQLEESGSYRVLRRLQPGINVFPDHGGEQFTGIVLDVETTGLDTRNNEIIELGMIKFTFSSQGELHGILDSMSAFQQPTRPISAEITELTGITD